MLLQQDSHIWNKNSRNLEFVNSLRLMNLSDQEFIKRIEDHDMYGIRINSENIKKYAMQWYKNNGFDGYNPNDIKMNYYLNEIKKLKGVKSILEIGGGMGKLAEKLINNGYKYTDIDITESLYATRVYLRNNCGIKKYTLVDINDVNDLYGREFDLVINTHSFGEMSNNDVMFWMDFIENKIKCKYFIGINRFLNTITSGDDYSNFRKNENIASISFDSRWKVIDWEHSPLVLNCPYEDTRAARCLKVVLLKTENPDIFNFDIEEIKSQDWFRYEARVGTNLSSPFRIELGINSTLFNLWNQIRINPTNEVIKLMVSYLDYLKRDDMEFEEKFSFLRMLNEN